MTGMTDKGGGVRQLLDNVAAILDSLPADENKRAEVTEILDDMVEGILRTTGQLSGEVSCIARGVLRHEIKIARNEQGPCNMIAWA